MTYLQTCGAGVKPCTLWFKHDPINGWVFNHLEDGHASTSKPTPKFASQSGWTNGKWSKNHRWLTADESPKVVHYGPGDLHE